MIKQLKLQEAGEYLRKHQQPARLAAVTFLVVAMSTWTSCTAWKTTAQARAATSEAVALRTSATRFSQQFSAATTSETDDWARTTEDAAGFGSPEASKVSLAQTVSRIAEVAGMTRAKVSFTASDGSGVAPPRAIGELSFQRAAYGLRLEATGSISAVSRVILRLPPATEITSLSISGSSDAPSATFDLVVYQPSGGPQN